MTTVAEAIADSAAFLAIRTAMPIALVCGKALLQPLAAAPANRLPELTRVAAVASTR